MEHFQNGEEKSSDILLNFHEITFYFSNITWSPFFANYSDSLRVEPGHAYILPSEWCAANPDVLALVQEANFAVTSGLELRRQQLGLSWDAARRLVIQTWREKA